MRITCIVPTLGAGGAERVMVHLCAGLAARGHQVTLLTLNNDVPDFYSAPETVRRVRAHVPPAGGLGLWGRFKRIWRLMRAIRSTKPEAVIDFMTLSVCLACWLLRVPFIFAVHLDITKVRLTRQWLKWRKFLLNRAAAVAVLSDKDVSYIRRHYPGWNPVVVYNPALRAPGVINEDRPGFLNADYNVIAVGRLTRQKGFDRLLEAWNLIRDEFPGWKLSVIGAGEEEQTLKELADALDVTGSVGFVPPVKNMAAVYAYADVYVMSSRYEGFPMVLVEAMAAGLPAVSFVCNGPDVIIRDGVDGFLVPQGDTDKLAARLAELMRSEEKRREFGSRARETADRFPVEKFIDGYEALCIAARK